MSACKPVHFYHLWRGGDWKTIADEHYAALKSAGFDGEVHVNSLADGWEDKTVNLLRARCEELPGDTPVLYCHNKGSFHPSEKNTLWRRNMTSYLVGTWHDCVKELESFDVVAWWWCWTELIRLPEGIDISPWPHAPGNFWWARADYIRGLPYLPALHEKTATEAERWIGQDEPAVIAHHYGESA